MSGISTDVIALAAILGSAAAAGATTIALTSDGSEHFSYRCATTVVESAPRVVVSMGRNADAVVVAPDVRVHTQEECSNVVRIAADGSERAAEVMERVERARERADRSRARADRSLDRVRRVHELESEFALRKVDLEGLQFELSGLEDGMFLELDGLDALIAAELEGLDDVLGAEIEGRLEDQMRELEKQLERLARGSGR